MLRAIASFRQAHYNGACSMACSLVKYATNPLVLLWGQATLMLRIHHKGLLQGLVGSRYYGLVAAEHPCGVSVRESGVYPGESGSCVSESVSPQVAASDSLHWPVPVCTQS